MSPAKTVAERKADERARMRAAGYVLVQVWVKPKDRKRLVRYVERLS